MTPGNYAVGLWLLLMFALMIRFRISQQAYLRVYRSVRPQDLSDTEAMEAILNGSFFRVTKQGLSALTERQDDEQLERLRRQTMRRFILCCIAGLGPVILGILFTLLYVIWPSA